MPLVLDPAAYDPDRLREVVRELREELVGTRELLEAPPGTVRDAAGLATAKELIAATLASVDRVDPNDPGALAGAANLAYATLLAAIDLMKSHTDMPKVPRRRPRDGE